MAVRRWVFAVRRWVFVASRCLPRV
jgi:hypothetical protein